MESLDLQLWTRIGTMNRCASQRRAPDRGSATRSRFMESPLSLLRTHWDHEPPLTPPSGTLSPSEGERDGVRGRFMARVSGSSIEFAEAIVKKRMLRHTSAPTT